MLGALPETEEVIKKRTIYLETSPPNTAVVTDLPAQNSESRVGQDDRAQQKEGKP